MNDARRTAKIKDRTKAVRTGAIAAAFAALAAASPLPAAAHSPTPLVSMELYDRTNGAVLDVYTHDGQRFVIGTPGHEYAIRIRNRSPARILAVTSVDGVNVISGETASPDQSGYVVDAGGSVEIAGWRRSFERTAAFFFADLGDSYAARTGRPADVGVVGLAVFRERQRAVQAATPMAAQAERSATRDEQTKDSGANAAPAAKLGTGFGRTETSFAYRVRFDRESDAPAETVAIRYDRRENLAALGVLPPPRDANRIPDPFPAMRFVPEPPR